MDKRASDEIINSLITQLVDKSRPITDGKAKDDDLHEFQELLEIFKRLFWRDNKDLFGRLQNARCTFENPETEAFPGESWAKIFEQLRKEQRPSYSELQKEADRIISKKQKALALQKFTLIFPVNITFVKRFKFKFGEDDLEIISYKQFRSEFFDLDAEIKKANSKENPAKLAFLIAQKPVNNEDFSYFSITTSAREYSFAVSYLSDKLFSILALLIFAKRRHQRPRHASLLPIKISTLVQSFVYVFKKKSYLDTSYPRGETLSEQEFETLKFFKLGPYVTEKYDTATFGFFSQLFGLYNKIASSDVGTTFDKALKSYYEASVANRLDYSIFYYWIAIESLLKVRPMKYEEMKRILKKISRGYEYSDLIVDALIETRHGFAHEGTMEAESPIRNRAKDLCDAIIDWFLLEFGKQFSHKVELGKIYTFVQEDGESLRTDKKIIDTILKAMHEPDN